VCVFGACAILDESKSESGTSSVEATCICICVEKRSTGARRRGPFLRGSERARGSKRAGASKCK